MFCFVLFVLMYSNIGGSSRSVGAGQATAGLGGGGGKAASGAEVLRQRAQGAGLVPSRHLGNRSWRTVEGKGSRGGNGRERENPRPRQCREFQFIPCVTLVKLLPLSGPQLFHLKKGADGTC